MMQAMVMSFARHLLTAAGAWAVTKGYLDDSAAQQIGGGVLAGMAVLWSYFEKRAGK